MSPSCDDLDPFFDGELAAEAADTFRDHLGACERCQRALRGRMLEAAVVATSRPAKPLAEPARPADVVPLRPKQGPPRWVKRVVPVGVLAAAAAAFVLWWKSGDHAPRIEGEMVAASEAAPVALALQAQREVDVRFSAPELDGYRARNVMRSDGPVAAEEIDLQALAGLERRADRRALVGALALSGNVSGARKQAEKLPETAASLSDRAAVALLETDSQKLQANAERALELARRARRLDPSLEQAIWNEAVALERLGLVLAAAEAFEEIGKRGGAGWAAEAKARAAKLRADFRGDVDRRKQLEDAAARMARGGAVMSNEDARSAPGLARGAFYLALAATADPARLAALALVAGTLGLAPELEAIRASDLARRAPVAKQLAEALEAYAVTSAQERQQALRALRAVRAQARAARLDDIARAVSLAILDRDLVDGDLGELKALASEGPWWRLVATKRHTSHLTYSQQRYAEADLVGHAALEACRERGRDAHWCPQILRTLAAANLQIGRVDHAYELAGEARRLAQESGDRAEEDNVFNATGQIAAMRVVDFDSGPVADAYLRESELRNKTCKAALYRLDFGAHAALDLHRYIAAAALLQEADRLTETSCKDEGDRFNAEEARLRLIVHTGTGTGTAAAVAQLEHNLRRMAAQWGAHLSDEDRLYSAFLLARARLATGGGPEHVEALRAAIAKARTLPASAYYSRVIQTKGPGALAEHAARRGAADETLAAIAQRLGVELEPGCVVGINHDERVTVVVRGADGHTAAEVRDVPEGQRVIDNPSLLGKPLRDRLARCPQIDVLATGPYLGVAGLLGPDLRWAYRLSPRRAAEAPRLADQVVVTDVDSPKGLGLPPLRRMQLGPAARVLEGADATPERVLAAMDSAGLVVINAHGITDADEPLAASLVLTPGADGSYWLTADRVRKARFAGAPVVVLAACHAGRVQVSTEPWSLASSFLAAGARAVIAPTTEIPDDTANEVFSSIVNRMQAGSSPEQAVAEERAVRGGKLPWLAHLVVFQ